MFVFIWERLAHVSEYYHAEGGLAVIADSIERAKSLAADNGVVFNPDIDTSVIAYELSNATVHEKVFIFPDAGCC